MSPAYDRHHGQLWPSPVQELVLRAALLNGDEALRAFHAWRGQIDLDGELDYAILKLLPLVYRNLQCLGLDDPMMGRLKGVYRRFWCENQTLFFALAPTLRHLQAGGVELLLLKGAPLVVSYYRNHALRPMADIDIAVRIAQLPRALELLKGLGWSPRADPSEDDRNFFHAVACDRGPLQLDLHYHLMRECVTPQQDLWFWSDVEPVNFQGVPALQLAPTALLLHTIVHGVRWNLETPIRWIPDAVAILRARSADLDWPRLLAFADAQRLTYRLALGLHYLTERLGVTLPTDVAGRLARYRPGPLERIANTAVLGASHRLFAHPVTKQWVMFADYCALAREDRPLRLAWGFSHYLRYRWQVRGRWGLIPAAWSGLTRRLGRS